MTSKTPPKWKEESKNANLSTTSTGGATLLIGLQIGSRALTFIVNQILLRFLSPSILGISTQLEVYSISVLFFARESLRVAIQRQTDTSESSPKDSSDPKTKPDSKQKQKDEEPSRTNSAISAQTPAGKSQAIVNLSYISIYLGIAFAVLLAWLYLRATTSDSVIQGTPYFQTSLKIYGIAAILELLSEPCFVVVQHKSMYKIRARAEAMATLLRCLACCSTAIWGARANVDLGVLPFAVGQVVFATLLGMVYYASVFSLASSSGFSLFLKPIFSSNPSSILLHYFPRPLLLLATSIFTQSLLKHLLTQGDTLLIALLSTPVAQGTYALANNYGGLLARLVLQPIEESSRNYIGKLLSTIDTQAPSKSSILEARTSLYKLLRSYTLFSVIVLAIGPTIAPQLLKIVAGSKWASSGAGEVLATYCYYIPLLAINGITEAFVSSVATQSEVHKQSIWMFFFSGAFGGASFVFLRVLGMGAKGLVWANVLNMVFRIIWSSFFIRGFLRRQSVEFEVGGLMPGPLSVAIGAVTFAALNRVAGTFDGSLLDLVKSGGVAGVFVITLAISERVYLLELYRTMRGNTS